MKIVRVLLSPEAEESYSQLEQKAADSKIERSIFNAVKKKVELIKAYIHYGDHLSRELFPKEYTDKYGITNLFRLELPNFWRMLYALSNGDGEKEIIVFVLDIIDHETYNKKFGYRRK